MQITERAAPRFRVDVKFARRIVLVNCLVPAVIFGWDALNGHLGANGVNYAIKTTGSLGLIFLFLSLTVTPLRRLTGAAELIGTRRTLGLASFFYLAAHFTIFFALDRGGSVSSTLHEMITRKYLIVGASALFAMIPLAVTSTAGMITRLGPKRWQALHRLVYLIAIGGVVHYVMLVKSDLRKPLAFAAALTLLLGFRVVDRLRKKPAASAKKKFFRGELVVAKTIDETPDVRTFQLALPGGGTLPFVHRPGQYLTLSLDIDGKRVTRSYTIASSPTTTDHLEITVKRITDGTCSRHLHAALDTGKRVNVAAPAGRFVFTGAESERVTLIGGGVGITPLMSIIRYVVERSWQGAIDLVFVVRREEDIVFRKELASLSARAPNLRTLFTLTNEPSASWKGERGRLTKEKLRAFAPEIARGRVYLCGPDPMMEATKALLEELSVPSDRVLTEAFVSPESARLDEPPAKAEPNASRAIDAGAGVDAIVTIERTRKSFPIAPDQTILEAAEEAGIDLPFDCRSGICGQCKARLVEGDVTMDVEDALSSGDRARGVILACQAHARGNVVIDP